MCKRINIDELTLEFCEKNPDKIDWSRINNSKTQLPDEFMRTFQHYLNWYSLSCHQDIPVDLVKLYRDKIDWMEMIERKQLPQTILILCPEAWRFCLFQYQTLSEEFIIVLVTIDKPDKIDWDNISRYQKLSPSFMKTYADDLDWVTMSRYQILPEYLIEIYQYRVDWTDIMKYQTLTDQFKSNHKFNYCLKDELFPNWNIKDIEEFKDIEKYGPIQRGLIEKYCIINKEIDMEKNKQRQSYWNRWRNRKKPDYTKYLSAIK